MKYSTIRKNASKKISGLIAKATMITIETQSMGLDDCFRSNGEVVISAEEVQQFMADNYNDLKIELQVNEDGSNFCMTISDGVYYFCDRITVWFQREDKPSEEKSEREIFEEAEAARTKQKQDEAKAEEQAELEEAEKALSEAYAMITDEVTRRRSSMLAKAKTEERCATFDIDLSEATAKRIERNILLSIIAEIIVNDDQAEEAEKEAVEAPQKPRILVGSAEYYQWLETADKAAEAAKIDADKTIETIEVLWSESPVFSRICSEKNEKRLISLSTYNKLYALAMMDADPEGGYFKTKCNITTKSGEFATFRHDIGHRDGTLADDWSSWVDYCRAEAEKRDATKH